jgi:hypothetical protein
METCIQKNTVKLASQTASNECNSNTIAIHHSILSSVQFQPVSMFSLSSASLCAPRRNIETYRGSMASDPNARPASAPLFTSLQKSPYAVEGGRPAACSTQRDLGKQRLPTCERWVEELWEEIESDVYMHTLLLVRRDAGDWDELPPWRHGQSFLVPPWKQQETPAAAARGRGRLFSWPRTKALPPSRK